MAPAVIDREEHDNDEREVDQDDQDHNDYPRVHGHSPGRRSYSYQWPFLQVCFCHILWADLVQ